MANSKFLVLFALLVVLFVLSTVDQSFGRSVRKKCSSKGHEKDEDCKEGKEGDKCVTNKQCCQGYTCNKDGLCQTCIGMDQKCELESNDLVNLCCDGYCKDNRCFCLQQYSVCDPKVREECCVGKCKEIKDDPHYTHRCGCDSSEEDCPEQCPVCTKAHQANDPSFTYCQLYSGAITDPIPNMTIPDIIC